MSLWILFSWSFASQAFERMLFSPVIAGGRNSSLRGELQAGLINQYTLCSSTVTYNYSLEFSGKAAIGLNINNIHSRQLSALIIVVNVIWGRTFFLHELLDFYQ